MSFRGAGDPVAADRPIASVSLDADNLWAYLKTHGDPSWSARPSYLTALTPRVLDLFGRHGITATVFVVGADAVRDDGAHMVGALSGAGHEIGNHSFEHEPWLARYSRSQLEDELDRTDDAVAAAGAPRPTGFRGPGYTVSADLLDALAVRGYHYDASLLPTWIGPLARAYYLRGATLTAAERRRRAALFGSLRDGLQPIRPFRWRGGTAGPDGYGLVELPVTTAPLLRIPMHASYVLHLAAVNHRVASTYVDLTLALCRARGVSPSLLLHPLDLLDARHAPGLEFFPGMGLSATLKARILDGLLARYARHFRLVGTGSHAAAVTPHLLGTADPARLGRSRQGQASAPAPAGRT